MVEFASAFLIGSLVAYLLYLNIKKITDKLDRAENPSYKIYSTFAAKVEEYVEEIRDSIGNKYLLKNENDQKEIKEKLSEIVRELKFFETVSVKRMEKEEAEEKLFDILSELDSILEKNFVNGREKADELREKLQKNFEEIKNDVE